MYGNPYINNYNQQSNIDRINMQINELEKIKEQIQKPIPPTNLTQNFQIAPTNREIIKYANSIDEVQRDMVVGDTPFFSKDMSVVWIKNTKGEIKTYELNEIIPKDSKDIQIEYLQEQIKELKGMIKDATNDAVFTNNNAEQDTTNTTEYDDTIRETIKSAKSTSVSKVSGSKKK